ncbi:MAG: hypothetical protein JWS12_598 [Candidatus Saccharibacteria bacterium]|nr:hypothetical protein [Candidatus Saccharibacteria bacterium]
MSEDNQAHQTEYPPNTQPEELSGSREVQETSLRHAGSLAIGPELSDDPAVHLEADAQKGEVDLGLLSAGEYRSRRSNTLIDNPEASLNEEQEIRSYFDNLDPEYAEQIKGLADIDSNPMNPECRMSVTIVAYGEGSRIRNTLEQYASQDIDHNLFEIVLLDNHPDTMPGDNTAQEVAKFKEAHPEISITSAHKTWNENEPATVGNARKYVFDIALARILNRGPNNKNTVLVSNDADILGFEPNYLADILAEFDNHSEEDALVTRMNLPPEAWAKPNLAAAVSLWDMLDRTIAEDDMGQPPEDRMPEPASLIGRSSAMRASIYAAVGGYNPKATLAEDTELGWMIGDARDWDASRITQFDRTSLTTDPRRYLVAIANRVPISEMFSDFQQNPEIRQMNNNEVLSVIPDAFDWEQFQDDADSFWQSQDTGMYKRLGNRFEPLFRSAMNKLGVQYEIVEGRLVLTNVDGLLTSLAGPDRNLEVVHSQPRTIDPEAVRDIKKFFSGIPKGVLEAWNAKADRIAEDIRLAQTRGEQVGLPTLVKRYERYAGHPYLVA